LQGACGVEEKQTADGCPSIADGLQTDIWDVFIDVVDKQLSESVALVLD